MASRASAFFALALLALLAPAAAMNCTGEITEDYPHDVYISNRSTCYIRDAKIGGSVYMSNGSNLETTGVVEIKGSFGILGIEAGYLNLQGKLLVEKIDMYNGTDKSHVTIRGAHVTLGGLKVEACTGDFIICDSRVDDVLEAKENKGNFFSWREWWAVPGWWGCGPNKFTKDVKIEAIVGDVGIVGASISSGELNVKGTIGQFTLKNVVASVSKLELNMGKVLIQNVKGGETDIKENVGGVELYYNDFSKLTCMDNAPGVTGYENDFGLVFGQCAAEELSE